MPMPVTEPRCSNTGHVSSRFETPLGPMMAVASETGLRRFEFIDETSDGAAGCPAGGSIAGETRAVLDRLRIGLDRYFAGDFGAFDVPLDPEGTAFELRVWTLLRQIAPGQTRSYLDMARTLGRPSATRAVARANARNRLAIIIPCHRVIGHDGTLTGYAGGLWRKDWLLRHEGARLPLAASR